MSQRFDVLEPTVLQFKHGVPYSTHFDDVYFSADSPDNGISESTQAYLNGNQLPSRWLAMHDTLQDRPFVIAELGFGTGLNMLLAWRLFDQTAPKSARLHLFSVETHPLSHADLMRCVALWPELKVYADVFMDAYPRSLTPGFHHCVLEQGRVQLTLMLGDALELLSSLLVCGDPVLEATLRHWNVDAWFLNGFLPAKNPDMWDVALLETIGLLSAPSMTMAGFFPADWVKRSSHTMKPETPWHVSKSPRIDDKKAIIVGAGLAGCMTAEALVKRGWSVVLIDKAASIASGASGNQQAILHPHVSDYASPYATWMLNAFLYATGYYKALLERSPDVRGELNGILQLAFNDKTDVLFQRLKPWLAHYPALAAWVSEAEASQLAEAPVYAPGLWIPSAGWLNSVDVCEKLAQTSGISLMLNQSMDALHYDSDNQAWCVAGERAPVLVMCTGYETPSFTKLADLPLQPARGQMTKLANSQASRLHIPLCAKGHVLSTDADSYWVGATYHHDTYLENTRDDDEANQRMYAELPIESNQGDPILDHWMGIRATTRDYLPVVGPVVNREAFCSLFHTMPIDATRFIASSGAYWPGLYVCAGFGSRGLTSIPLSTAYLAGLINQDPAMLPTRMMQWLSPARFVQRELVRRR